MAKSQEHQQYASQASVYDRFAKGGREEALAKTWFDKTTVDAWRHERMYDALQPIVHNYPGSCWLTIGDGRYGCDAAHLAGKGMKVLATDIGDTLLQEALASGHISACRKENAELLSFPDGAFDFVLCKESYHHCPRPMVALYEMLRVASQAVVLIEPNDYMVNQTWAERATDGLLSAVKRLLRRASAAQEFEEAGNYVYRVSQREIEKAALGLGLRYVAFKGINDHYMAGVEHEKMAANGPLFRKVRSRIRFKNVLCQFHLRQYDLLATVIFKVDIDDGMKAGLAEQGYRVVELPKNPFVEQLDSHEGAARDIHAVDSR